MLPATVSYPERDWPAPQADRLQALDSLRGFAVLGILLMNIIGFSMFANAYVNPAIAGGAEGVNLAVYHAASVLVDGKMRGIFSLLFGASTILLLQRFETKGLGILSADLYFRRLLWLGLIGIAHAFLLWYGEILYQYALCGLFIFPFRRMSNRGLYVCSVAAIILMTAFMTFDAFESRKLRDDAMRFAAWEKQGRPLDDKQAERKKKWEEKYKNYYPEAKTIEKDRKAFATNFVTALPRRAELVIPWHSMPFYSPKNWDPIVMMLLGMALFRSGFLAGASSTGTYVKTAIFGYLAGLPLAIWSTWNFAHWKFDIVASGFSMAVYEPSRIAICLAHVSVFLLLLRSGWLRGLFSTLAAAGQMAFTNYLMQSVLCTLIFTGLHLYGTLERYQVLLVALGIWTVELIWSPLWLKHFRYGPFEWCWRSLTYWKRQPMRSTLPEKESAPRGDIEPTPA